MAWTLLLRVARTGLLAFCMRDARLMREMSGGHAKGGFRGYSLVGMSQDVQIVALNLSSEGAALDFYTAVIPVLRRLGILSGRYWSVHSDIDDRHLRLGFDNFGDVTPDSPKGQAYSRGLW